MLAAQQRGHEVYFLQQQDLFLQHDQLFANIQQISVHGWVYGLSDGHVKDLNCTINGLEQVETLYRIDRLQTDD